ncbi:Hpt domain-containing protein [Ralstonia sp. CHL-2022]|uniref:histidine kinase n=1 Tax=Ralstonia mojiangensis TaxID=2953895 RepID=A0ABT2L5Z9_9RALS|nr:Hpt domain-containing protein [Ralstonia mojiangensis]MCT7297542.1 Hpt domain-containing protein [Ralstonia mojiangensis]MCT7310134.1 Hpt domain-containing protein [Ralstonia mojiangensis]
MRHQSAAEPAQSHLASLEVAGAPAVRSKSAVPARDLSALAWVAPNMRAALDDAVREFGEYAADVIANPEVIGARDTTSLRLAGQYLHQAAGALLIVGLRGVDVYCQAAKRLLEAVDAGTVAADAQTLDVFSRAVQALQEYVADLMAGMAEEPLRLFQPYQAVLARLGEERVHPADLWADELRHLPALLLPSRDLPGLARLRRKFELALLTALRAPASNADGAQVDPSAAAAAYAPLEDLLHGIRALEREPRRAGDDLQRDLWLVLALTFGALRAGLVPADMTAKRLAARVNLLLRQYSHNNVHLPQGLLTDALYLLAGMAYSNAPAAPVGDDTLGPDIMACVQAFAIPPTHAPAGALHTRQYYALLPADASDTLQRVGRSLETLSQQSEPAADELDAALQTLALHADALGQPALTDLSNRLTEAAGQDVAPTLQFLSRMLARPWALHGESGDLRSAWFAARCSELAEHARATQDGHAVPAPAWLTLLAEEAVQRRARTEQVRALQTLLASAETHLDAFEREGEESGGLQEAARLFGEMQTAFAALDAYEAVHATEAAQSTINALHAAGEGATADRERYLAALAANVSGLQALLDALSAGTELTGGQVDEIVIEGQLTPTERETAWREFAFDAESGMLNRREPQSETLAGAGVANADAASPLQSLLDRLLAKQPVDPTDPLAAELRTALQEARDAAAIDDDPARRRRLEEALAQFDAWQVGSAGALERMQAALAAPAAVPAAAAAPALGAVRDTQSIDAELLDIFLSEAEEVLAGVRADLHGLQAAADMGTGGLAAGSDLDLLTQLRRAFHTLKGSGRMVGLTRYGEAAWAIEQVMNVWLAESRVPTHDLAALLARAESELSTWAAAIAQSPQADHAIEPLVAAAERVRHGGPFVWLEAVPEAQAAPEHVEPQTPEAPAAETASHDVDAVQPMELAAPDVPVAEAEEAVALTWDDEPPLPEVEAPMPEATAPVVEHEAVEPVAEHVEEAHQEAAAEPVAADADAKVIPFPFAQTGEPEEAPHDDGVKEIGPVRISVALYNVYLQEADDLIRRLGVDFSEWRHEGRTPPSELALRAAHTLQGSSAVVELEPVRQLAGALEQVLLNLNSRPVAMHPGDFRLLDQSIERMRGMLHQFAASLWPESDEAMRRSLDELCERLLVRPRLPLEPAPAAFTEAEQAENETAGLAGEPEFEPAEITPTFVPSLVPVHESPVAEPAVGELVRSAPADALDPALLEIFLEEAHVALPELGQHLRAWEAAPQDRNAAGLLLRNLHTVKGSARMAGAMTLGQAAHEMESAIEGGLRQNRVDDALFRKLYVWFDRIQAHVDALGAGNLLPLDAGLADATEAPQTAADAQTSSGTSMLPAVAVSTNVDLTGARSPEAEALEVAERQRAMVRVQARALDSLINDAGEVGAARARLESEVDALKTYLSELNDNVARLRSQVREIEIQAETQMESRIADAAAHDESFDPLEFDRFTRLQELTRMMAESVNDVATVQQNLFRGFDQASLDLETQARLTRGLQRSLMRARMVQFDTVADRLYRVARQAASETGKEVRLFIKGGTVELDRSVLDRMGGPLEHMIRNAVAHGIESADERRAKGKNPAGELTLEVQQEGNEVVLHFVDDGAGLNLDRIRARALERQLLAPDEEASDARLTEMIFTPGFSTADQVSELAGRGVGMDVVRAETVALGGRISLQTTPEVGTRFTIHLPLTTAITQVLLVRVSERVYAIPSGMIDHVQQLRPQALAEAYNAAALQLPTGPVPFHYFGALLEEAKSVTGGRKYSPAVVVRNGAERAAVHVDEVIGNREVVVKHIGPHLARLEGIAGATTLGDGEIVLIYNPVVLTQRFEREAAARGLSDQEATGAVAELHRDGSTDAVPGLATQPIVMVVDDSLTVRKVTQRLLTRSGYQAVLARDGVDALRQLQEITPDAMLVDIEMPHMDGFDLTRNVRADERIGATPIIMITSRTADKHRRYAAEIGVNVYLGKPYNEEELLQHLRNLIGERAPAANAG